MARKSNLRCALGATVSLCASGFAGGVLVRPSNPTTPQQHRGSKAEHLAPLSPPFDENGDRRGSELQHNGPMQHQQLHHEGSQLLHPDIDEISDLQEDIGAGMYVSAGTSSEDMITGGSSSSEDFYNTGSSCSSYESTEESEEDGCPFMKREERCFDSTSYRDSNNNNEDHASSSDQLPPLGRHYSAQPFFSSHMSRHHQSHDDQQQGGVHGSMNGLAHRQRTPTLSAIPGRLATGSACAAVVVAMIAPLAQALSSHWPYFVAGGICAAVSHTAAVPLDVLKTRIQTAEPGEYRGTWDALMSIWRLEGGRVLFGGAGATLVGYAMQGCLKFGFFEFLKPLFSTLIVGSTRTASCGAVLSSLVAASLAAEVVGSSALTPLEAARIRMVSDTSYAPGLRSGIARMISEEGMGALTRGLPAVLAKQIPYTVTKLVSFDFLTRSARKSGSGSGVGVTVACAIAAGMLSSLASQPGDSLLSTLHSERRSVRDREEDGGSTVVEPVAVAMARIAREAGFFGLFRGTSARMLHVTAIVTLQLFIYQSVKNMVGIS